MHMYTGVCVCVEAERPRSGRMCEHARPAGVNKQLITLKGKNPQRNPVILHIIHFFLSCMVIRKNKPTACKMQTYLGCASKSGLTCVVFFPSANIAPYPPSHQ